MPWQTGIPPAPARTPVTGWFAVINILAGQTITIANLAHAIGIMSAVSPLNILSSAATAGAQFGNQSFSANNAGSAAVKPTAAQDFSITDSATWYGKPGASNPLIVVNEATVIGLVLSAQQLSIINEGLVTGFEGTLAAQQFVSIVDAATVAGLRAAGQTFTVVDGATLAGRPGANQAVAITDTGQTVGVSVANSSFLVSNTGVVYARLTGAQTFSITNSAIRYGKPGAAQSFVVTSAATAVLGPNAPAFAAASNGARSGSSNSQTALSWTQNVPGNNSHVYVGLVSSNQWPTVARLDGTTMDLVAEQPLNNNNLNGYLRVYRLTGVSSGDKAMTGGAGAGNFMSPAAVSIVYTGVGSEDAAQTAYGSGTALSQSGVAGAGQRIVQFFGARAVSGNMNITSTGGGSARAASANGSFQTAGVIRDSETNATFTSTASATSHWAGIIIPLNNP